MFAPSGKSTDQQLPRLSFKERQELIQSCSADWQLHYQRRIVQEEKITLDLEVGIPQSEVSHMLDTCFSSKTPHRFSFPVAFNQDLNQLIFVSSILSIRCKPKSTVKEPRYEHMVQTLDRARSSGLDVNLSRRRAYSVFSPSSKALAFVSNSTPSTNRIWEEEQIEVWSDVAACGGWPQYQFRGEVTATRMKAPSMGEAPANTFTFHQTDQVLFFDGGNKTTAWRFDEQGKSGRHPYDLLSQAYI
jgi:hypothetical protein